MVQRSTTHKIPQQAPVSNFNTPMPVSPSMNRSTPKPPKKAEIKRKIVDKPKSEETISGKICTEVNIEIQWEGEKGCISALDEGDFTKIWEYVKPGMDVKVSGIVNLRKDYRGNFYEQFIINNISFENCSREEDPYNAAYYKKLQNEDYDDIGPYEFI